MPIPPRIMYIERMTEGRRTLSARIGRVSFSKTGRTLYYDGMTLWGEGQPYYRDVESGEVYVIQNARPDGLDRSGGHNRGSFPVEIDDDVRVEYWTEIRGEPKRSHERVYHC